MDDEIALSTTGFSDAALCLKRYDYRWNERLVSRPSTVREVIRRGTWIHRALELIDRDQPWLSELAGMRDWAVDHGIDESIAAGLYEEVTDLVTDYQAYWAGHNETPGPWTTVATEVRVSWQPAIGRSISATLDCIKRDAKGRLWIWERKSTGQIPDSDWRNVDPQTMLQYIACRATGEYPVVGIVFDYVLTEPGPALRVKLDGRFYAGLEDKTVTSRAFAEAEKAVRVAWKATDKKGQPIDAWNGPDDYLQSMRMRMVNDGKWFQRYTTYRPDDNAKQTLKDVAVAMRHVADARKTGHWQRSFHVTTCSRFCPYGPVCVAEYISGRRAEVLRNELYVIETPEIRSEGRSSL